MADEAMTCSASRRLACTPMALQRQRGGPAAVPQPAAIPVSPGTSLRLSPTRRSTPTHAAAMARGLALNDRMTDPLTDQRLAAGTPMRGGVALPEPGWRSTRWRSAAERGGRARPQSAARKSDHAAQLVDAVFPSLRGRRGSDNAPEVHACKSGPGMRSEGSDMARGGVSTNAAVGDGASGLSLSLSLPPPVNQALPCTLKPASFLFRQPPASAHSELCRRRIPRRFGPECSKSVWPDLAQTFPASRLASPLLANFGPTSAEFDSTSAYLVDSGPNLPGVGLPPE